MKILYLSEFVVGRPDGPGVNELEFWKSLSSHAVDSEGVFAEHRGGDKKTKYEYLIRQLYLLKKIFLFALSGKKIDVIIARSGPLPLATLVASLLLRSPVYIKTVGDGAFKVLADNKSLLHKLGYFLCRLLWKMLLKRAVAVDAVSKAHILNFSRNLNFPLRLCYEIDNGVNTDFFDGRKKTNSIGSDFNSWRKKYSKIVGYVGGYPLERGASELILLSSKLKKLGIGVLVVGGDKNTIEEFVKRNGQGNVWVAGQVEYAAVPGYMSEMDVGVSLLDKAAWGGVRAKASTISFVGCSFCLHNCIQCRID